MKKQPQRILIEFESPVHHHTRECLMGIFDYALRFGDGWEFLSDPFDAFLSFQPGALSIDTVDAAIIWSHHPTPTTRKLSERKIPAVNLTVPDEPLPFPLVSTDNEAMGRSAATNLNRPYIQHHVYVGPDYERSRILANGFRKGLKAYDRKPPEVFIESLTKAKNSAVTRLSHLHNFIQAYRRTHKGPLAFYAFSDSFALAVINAATHLGLSVPGDIYVLGTANEPIVCTMCPIPISSVPHQSRLLGFTAAKILHALMRGETVPKRTLIEPDAVIERRSSSHLAVSDPLIEKALRIMQEKAVQGMNIKELMAFLPLCRRAFEVRFRQMVGYSPHEELERIRLGKALSLLAGNAGTNSQIAAASGFSSSIYMEHLIRKKTGKRPRDLRLDGSPRNQEQPQTA